MREQDILCFITNAPINDYDDRDLVDHELIDICRESITKNLTTLKYIPSELGNTIANIYYKLCLLTKIDIRAASWFPDKEDIVNNCISFIKSYNKLKTDIISIPDFIKWLREIDRYNEPELYNYSVEFVIDCLKYDIEDIGFKTLDERMKERDNKKQYIREISNLVYILDV